MPQLFPVLVNLDLEDLPLVYLRVMYLPLVYLLVVSLAAFQDPAMEQPVVVCFLASPTVVSRDLSSSTYMCTR